MSARTTVDLDALLGLAAAIAVAAGIVVVVWAFAAHHHDHCARRQPMLVGRVLIDECVSHAKRTP